LEFCETVPSINLAHSSLIITESRY